MNREKFNQVIADYTDISKFAEGRLKAIGPRYRPQFRSHYIDELGAELTSITAFTSNYESGGYSIPTDWLFAENWEELVDREVAAEISRMEAAK